MIPTKEEEAIFERLKSDFEDAMDLAVAQRVRAERAERERDMSFSRVDDLANEVQTERNARLALVKENIALIAELELLRARVTQRGAQA